MLDRDEHCETVIITRHGTPIATLQPYEEPVDSVRVAKAIGGILALRAAAVHSSERMLIDIETDRLESTKA